MQILVIGGYEHYRYSIRLETYRYSGEAPAGTVLYQIHYENEF